MQNYNIRDSKKIENYKDLFNEYMNYANYKKFNPQVDYNAPAQQIKGLEPLNFSMSNETACFPNKQNYNPTIDYKPPPQNIEPIMPPIQKFPEQKIKKIKPNELYDSRKEKELQKEIQRQKQIEYQKELMLQIQEKKIRKQKEKEKLEQEELLYEMKFRNEQSKINSRSQAYQDDPYHELIRSHPGIENALNKYQNQNFQSFGKIEQKNRESYNNNMDSFNQEMIPPNQSSNLSNLQPNPLMNSEYSAKMRQPQLDSSYMMNQNKSQNISIQNENNPRQMIKMNSNPNMNMNEIPNCNLNLMNTSPIPTPIYGGNTYQQPFFPNGGNTAASFNQNYPGILEKMLQYFFDEQVKIINDYKLTIEKLKTERDEAIFLNKANEEKLEAMKKLKLGQDKITKDLGFSPFEREYGNKLESSLNSILMTPQQRQNYNNNNYLYGIGYKSKYEDYDNIPIETMNRRTEQINPNDFGQSLLSSTKLVKQTGDKPTLETWRREDEQINKQKLSSYINNQQFKINQEYMSFNGETKENNQNLHSIHTINSLPSNNNTITNTNINDEDKLNNLDNNNQETEHIEHLESDNININKLEESLDKVKLNKDEKEDEQEQNLRTDNNELNDISTIANKNLFTEDKSFVNEIKTSLDLVNQSEKNQMEHEINTEDREDEIVNLKTIENKNVIVEEEEDLNFEINKIDEKDKINAMNDKEKNTNSSGELDSQTLKKSIEVKDQTIPMKYKEEDEKSKTHNSDISNINPVTEESNINLITNTMNNTEDIINYRSKTNTYRDDDKKTTKFEKTEKIIDETTIRKSKESFRIENRENSLLNETNNKEVNNINTLTTVKDKEDDKNKEFNMTEEKNPFDLAENSEYFDTYNRKFHYPQITESIKNVFRTSETESNYGITNRSELNDIELPKNQEINHKSSLKPKASENNNNPFKLAISGSDLNMDETINNETINKKNNFTINHNDTVRNDTNEILINKINNISTIQNETVNNDNHIDSNNNLNITTQTNKDREVLISKMNYLEDSQLDTSKNNTSLNQTNISNMSKYINKNTGRLNKDLTTKKIEGLNSFYEKFKKKKLEKSFKDNNTNKGNMSNLVLNESLNTFNNNLSMKTSKEEYEININMTKNSNNLNMTKNSNNLNMTKNSNLNMTKNSNLNMTNTNMSLTSMPNSDLNDTKMKDDLILNKCDNFAKVALGQMEQSELDIFKKKK